MFADDLDQRLQETIVWCAHKADRADPKNSLRSNALKPRERLFDVFQRIKASLPVCRRQKELVDEVCILRRQTLSSMASGPPTITTHLSDGRILLLDTSSTMYDEVALSFSDGLFDESDAPPWDTWIDYAIVENLNNSEDHRGVLVAWIPEVLLSTAQVGIDSCPGECLWWADNGSDVSNIDDILRLLESAIRRVEAT